jgi:hypothetical protein
MTNLTDGSVEGIAVDGLGAEGIQFHPEAGPGPHDALGVFARFLTRCEVSSDREQGEGEGRGKRGTAVAPTLTCWGLVVPPVLPSALSPLPVLCPRLRPGPEPEP